MTDTIYIEDAVRGHPRAEAILRRFPRAEVIRCSRYGEVFNRRAQDFRLQKRRPALILAHKHGDPVLDVPTEQCGDAYPGFYFSHLLNCPFDCRYCFLQGMFLSASHVLFVNYEDFAAAIRERAATCPSGTFFFSGYDCDSLALDPLTRFTEYFLPVFAGLDGAWLELRTKSVQIRTLLERDPQPRTVVAYSLAPDAVARAHEHGAPTIDRRIAALGRLATAGWSVGLRIDPLIHLPQFRRHYRELIEAVFRAVDADAVHSATLGPLRFPRAVHDRMATLHPDEPLLVTGLVDTGGTVSYPPAQQEELVGQVEAELARFLPAERIHVHLPAAVAP